MAFINLQLPWPAQLKLRQVYLPAAQSQQHWATEAQAEKPLFCPSEFQQDTPCWGGHRGTGRKRGATNAKGTAAAWDPAVILLLHDPSHLLFIRNNHNCHHNRVFSQHQCHSNCLKIYCFSCSTFLWHFSILPPHFYYKRGQTIPLTSFLKRNRCKTLYKIWFIQQQKPKSFLEKMLTFLKLSFKYYKINWQKSINVPIQDFLY